MNLPSIKRGGSPGLAPSHNQNVSWSKDLRAKQAAPNLPWRWRTRPWDNLGLAPPLHPLCRPVALQYVEPLLCTVFSFAQFLERHSGLQPSFLAI